MLEKELTADETQQLQGWLSVPENREFFDSAIESGELHRVANQAIDWNETRLDRKMAAAVDMNTTRPTRIKILAFVVAASILVLVVSASLFYHQTQRPGASKGITKIAKDILPATNKARLKLANGDIVLLDSTRNGQIATQGNMLITKSHGQIAYNSTSGTATPLTVVNELTVPRGGQFELRLPDGSHVWLNSSTVITYPVTFAEQRRVKIDGEAFFDIVGDPNKPFIVETPHGTTQVLGTTFNLTAYDDDEAELTTVISGAVRVTVANKDLTLRSGEQALENKDKLSLQHPNVQSVTAWRRGFFHFDNANVQSIMRQLSRFYDVTVTYQGQPSNETYDGLISRDLKLTDALSVLNNLNIKATLTDRTITVSPATARP